MTDERKKQLDNLMIMCRQIYVDHEYEFVSTLINKLYTDKFKLSHRDYFDLGKHYYRFINHVNEGKLNKEQMEAVMGMKAECYGGMKLSINNPY